VSVPGCQFLPKTPPRRISGKNDGMPVTEIFRLLEPARQSFFADGL
jgi:hypothetical protein